MAAHRGHADSTSPRRSLKCSEILVPGLRKDKVGDLVLAQVWVEQWRIRLSAPYRVKYGWQFLVFHLDELGRLVGYFLAGGHNSGNRLTHKAHPVPGKDGPVDEVQTNVVGHILPGDDGLDAGYFQGFVDVYALDQSMGVRTPDQAPIVEPRTKLHDRRQTSPTQ